MPDAFDLPPLMNEASLKGERKLKRERELLDLAIKRAEDKLKQIDKKDKP
jgi:hypothetical protein